MNTSAQDFDFLHGHWRVEHHRLRERLCGCTDWDRFDGTCTAQPLLGGHGNVDDNLLHLPGGSYRAARTASPHWEQAFSAHGGTTWEVNWTMRFHRLPA